VYVGILFSFLVLACRALLSRGSCQIIAVSFLEYQEAVDGSKRGGLCLRRGVGARGVGYVRH
jgi:hypothetical protein